MVARWRKAGIVRLSRSKKVILLAVHDLASHKWLIVDVEDIFSLLELKAFEIPILEVES